MAYWKRKGSVNVDKPVFAFAHGIETPHSVTIANTTVTADSDGNKVMSSGYYVSRIGTTFRLLPRTKVATTAFGTGAATGKVNDYKPFVVGDVLRLLFPYATVTLAGTWGASETLTVSVAGVSNTYVAGDTVLATIASNIAALINADPLMNSRVEAIASGAVIYLFAVDGISLHSLSVSETAASGTATASGSALAFASTAIGTILSIDPATNQITLSANAGVAAPIGAVIGVVVDEVLGLYGKSLDLTDTPTVDIYAATAAVGVYKNVLPHVDGDLMRRLPKLTIAEKF